MGHQDGIDVLGPLVFSQVAGDTSNVIDMQYLRWDLLSFTEWYGKLKSTRKRCDEKRW